MNSKNDIPLATNNNAKSQEHDVTIEKIPNEIYQGMIDLFENEYHFKNGEQMRINNYYVKISRSLSDIFVTFIEQVIKGFSENKFPNITTPDGFKPNIQNLLETELNGGFSLGSFDMAITENGLQNIEFQAVATYPISAAKMNQYLLDNLGLNKAYIFADSPSTNWNSFINLYDTIIGGGQREGVVLVDRKIKEQKTNFEFFATQKELASPVEIVDLKDVFKKDNELFYETELSRTPTKITRFYNRVLLAEALFEDDYPNNHIWNFRFDEAYKALKFVNHPIKQFDVSKRLSPYLKHPFNPDCYELSEAAELHKKGTLSYNNFVWKHKWGAAGHRLVLDPSKQILNELSNHWKDYVAQQKVNYKVFKTDDNQDKIIELRFMTAIQNNKMIIVPMARLGHVSENENGNIQYKIHFGDNNKEGYGFSPVMIMDN